MTRIVLGIGFTCVSFVCLYPSFFLTAWEYKKNDDAPKQISTWGIIEKSWLPEIDDGTDLQKPVSALQSVGRLLTGSVIVFVCFVLPHFRILLLLHSLFSTHTLSHNGLDVVQPRRLARVLGKIQLLMLHFISIAACVLPNAVVTVTTGYGYLALGAYCLSSVMGSKLLDNEAYTIKILEKPDFKMRILLSLECALFAGCMIYSLLMPVLALRFRFGEVIAVGKADMSLLGLMWEMLATRHFVIVGISCLTIYVIPMVRFSYGMFQMFKGGRFHGFFGDFAHLDVFDMAMVLFMLLINSRQNVMPNGPVKLSLEATWGTVCLVIAGAIFSDVSDLISPPVVRKSLVNEPKDEVKDQDSEEDAIAEEEEALALEDGNAVSETAELMQPPLKSVLLHSMNSASHSLVSRYDYNFKSPYFITKMITLLLLLCFVAKRMASDDSLKLEELNDFFKKVIGEKTIENKVRGKIAEFLASENGEATDDIDVDGLRRFMTRAYPADPPIPDGKVPLVAVCKPGPCGEAPQNIELLVKSMNGLNSFNIQEAKLSFAKVSSMVTASFTFGFEELSAPIYARVTIPTMEPIIFKNTQVFKDVSITIKLAAVCQRDYPFISTISVHDVSIDTPMPELRLPADHQLAAYFGEMNVLGVLPEINEVGAIRSALISRLQAKVKASEETGKIPLGGTEFTPVELLNHLISMNTAKGVLDGCTA
jgi:hypothetical protein